MALWKDSNAPSGTTPAATPPTGSSSTVADFHPKTPEKVVHDAVSTEAQRRAKERGGGVESVIAADLQVEGKIVGAGNVRMAGRFKGDVHVDGNFRIDAGARLDGHVRASVVVVGGELEGNIDTAKHVDVLETGVIVGDVKAGSITVASGSRMRGHVEFGWGDEKALGAVEIKGTSRTI
jgi:cytoskeletal protein CcmA (bactofilin family)